MLVHRDLHLRDVVAEPGHGGQRAGQRQADAIGVAFVEPEAGRLHRSAEDVEREHRRGQQQAVAVDALEFLGRDPLAARNPHQVGQQQVDGADLAVAPSQALACSKSANCGMGSPDV